MSSNPKQPKHDPDFFQLVQEACLPGVWSKGVSLARAQAVLVDSISEDETILRVHTKDRTLSPKVSLFPCDEDWFCDCGDKINPCAHVAAAVIAIKGGQFGSLAESDSGQSTVPQVYYRFSRQPEGLALERFIGASGQNEVVLSDSLVSYIGGVNSGRISGQRLATTREDFAADAALGARRRGVLERSQITPLFAALKDCANVTLDGARVQVSPKPIGPRARVTEAPDGYRLEILDSENILERFKNGAVLCASTLHPHQTISSTLASNTLFERKEVGRLILEVLPSLERTISVEIVATTLPRPVEVKPRVEIRLEHLGSEILAVTPEIIYDAGPGEIANPDPVEERNLARRLQSELHLQPGQVARFEGQEAVEFTRKLAGWNVTGTARSRFTAQGKLIANVELTPDGYFELSFGLAGSRDSIGGAKVLQAWRENLSYVPLPDGNWATLPKDWLEKNAHQVERLLAARDGQKKLPAYHLPEALAVCDELALPYDETLARLKTALEKHDQIPEAEVPEEMRKTLRSYQRQGVAWLQFMGKAGMGALLADDMGLGKTLQTLCALRGRTLVVAPTSVVHAWIEQACRFRPELSISLYHGSARQLDSNADITLTTYAVLRLDQDALTTHVWDTVVLDEAQTIKNPDSQIARAAHRLKADFRIALSGTPVENRLEDLWSQFQFLNPGLLGSRSQFQEEYASAIARSDARAAESLRRRIRPFLLRRLKRDVAPELPPRTEIVLHCELSDEERELYNTLLAAARSEVLEKLESGTGVLAALELLLRLRQACCHPALVPGQVAESSSKLELLMQTLESSIEGQHRALVFSQWTSYLDLVQKRLQAAGIRFLRLDGGTRDRQSVVEAFQADDGPPVLLISLKAGGTGLTLTAADHVFILDPWWNPAVEDQAADRTHRIGQENPVLVHRLAAKDTIEEAILELQKRKHALAQAALHDASSQTQGAFSLSRDELLDLLRG